MLPANLAVMEIITINDGTIHLVASDDGINASGGNGEAAMGGPPMRGGGPGGFESGDSYLYINGGYIPVDANGDGIDANGPIEMTAGTVIVNGPTNDGNGLLDYLGAFNISGGYLVAVGSSGMAKAPSTTSTQYSAMYTTLHQRRLAVRWFTSKPSPVRMFSPSSRRSNTSPCCCLRPNWKTVQPM